ncbi:TRAP-type C4-dicarboxylate transport system substrate-binding protein [Desulfobaculum xiamenense]|uniref:TRAP-type C4-dicarboxylate transport system substrate-binding protein n=1 Tax=Desulfobaculum xiamenense TaxID=995050 RepID=A0A846QRI9_9BACT|nr:TRAP transporter substrate-binding protein [Desulfobaculum xiamenense]NJB67995.1 TRAP-type C4-dicarboxylate transport system substrate-binding protein [Desulfobaculum xiamenense]
MRTRTLRTWLACVAMLVLMAASQANAGMDLPMSSIYMNTHPTVTNAWEPWFKEMAKATGGEVELTYFNPNTLCPISDYYDSTVSGMLAIGAMDCPRNPGKFDLSNVLELPGLVPGAECGSLIISDLYAKYPEIQAEYKDIRLMWHWASATYQLHTTTPVRTMADLKGMKIIAWNRTSINILNALGANPIQLPPTDNYLALERGMADGVLCPLAPIVSYKISEAVKYTTICDLFANAFWAGMNKDLWDGLSDGAKTAFTETTGKVMARRCGVTLDEGAIRDSETLKKGGHEFIVLDAAERDRWIAATAQLRENWIAEMEGRGFKNARAIVEDAFRLRDQYAGETGRGFKM